MAYKKIVFILQKHVCLVDMVSTCYPPIAGRGRGGGGRTEGGTATKEVRSIIPAVYHLRTLKTNPPTSVPDLYFDYMLIMRKAI